MTTLGDLRVFARETASHDVSGATANREIQYWINAALARIWSAHTWSHAQTNDRITMDKEETGSGLTVVEGSRQLVLVAETFLEKYLDERWHLHVSGEGRLTFELAEIQSVTTALMRSQHRWVRDSDTGVSYTWSRHIYPLPDDAKEIQFVETSPDAAVLEHVPPARFDRIRQQYPTQRGNTPLKYTVRGGNLEVWPSPGSSWKVLLITYKRKPPSYVAIDDASGGDDDDTQVDWPSEWDDLLHKAVLVEAALTQGKNAPIPYTTAWRDFTERLQEYKAEDSGVVNLTGPLGARPMSDGMQITGYPSTIPDAS